MVTPRRRGEPIPDEVIVERLTDAQLTMVRAACYLYVLTFTGERDVGNVQCYRYSVVSFE